MEFLNTEPLYIRLCLEIIVLQYGTCNLFLFSGGVRMNPIIDSEKVFK